MLRYIMTFFVIICQFVFFRRDVVVMLATVAIVATTHDLSNLGSSHVWDHSAVNAIAKVILKYQQLDKKGSDFSI